MKTTCFAILAFLVTMASTGLSSDAAEQAAEPKKPSLLVIDFSGWRSSGLPDRVTNPVQGLYPRATVISIGIQEDLPAEHPKYDLIVSVRNPDLQAVRRLISDRIAQAAGASPQVVVHIDINEAALPQQLREVFGVQLFGANETRGPGQLGAALIEACGAKLAETLVLRGHSDGTWCEGYMLQALQKAGIVPNLVILESPRERWDVWKSRFAQFPPTFFVGITAERDLPRNGIVDFGFGRAHEVSTQNYVNVHLEKWDGRRVPPHSAPSAYMETFQQVRIRGPVGGNFTDCRLDDVALGVVVQAVASRPKDFGVFTQRLAGAEQNRVVCLQGFPQTGDQKADQMAQAGLIAIRTMAVDPAVVSGVRLVIREAGDHELSPAGNRGSLPHRDSPLADPAQIIAAKVFVGNHVLECPSGKDLAVAIASRLATAASPAATTRSVPMWSTTPDFVGPDTARMTDFARQRLDRPGFARQPVLVVGNDEKANRMALNLMALGVEVIRLPANLSQTEAETLGQQTGAAAVLRVGQPPLLGVQVSPGAAAAPPRTERQGVVDGYLIEQVSGTRWSLVREKDSPPADSIWVYDGEGEPAPAIAKAVGQKAKELGLPTGPGNKTKVVVGGDPQDPKFLQTVKALSDLGYEVIKEEWNEEGLTTEQKKARVAKRAREVGATLAVVDAYTAPEGEDDEGDDGEEPPHERLPLLRDDDPRRRPVLPPNSPGGMRLPPPGSGGPTGPDFPPNPPPGGPSVAPVRVPVLIPVLTPVLVPLPVTGSSPSPAKPPPSGPKPAPVASRTARPSFSSRPLQVGTPLSDGLGSSWYVGAVGGIAFDAVATPAAGLDIKDFTLRYDPQRPDGRRLCVTIDGRSCYAAGLPDWQLVPIARFADSPYYAVVTLFGELEAPESYQPGTSFIVAFHPAFENTLLGLRLWQADVPFSESGAELPRFGERCVLASGEELPDPSLAVPASRALCELYATAGASSYVICDAGTPVTFAVRFEGQGADGQICVQGSLNFHYWNRGPATIEQALDVRTGKRTVRSGNRVDRVGRISELVSSQTGLLERANPAVYHALTNTMRYAALFRYARHRDAKAWREFLRSLDAVPEAEYRFPTPVLMLRQLTAEGHAQLGQTRLNAGRDQYAIVEFSRAIQLDPKHVLAYELRGEAYRRMGEYEKALADYEQALRLELPRPERQTRLAWFLATCPEAKYRDGARAVELATQAGERTKWKDRHVLDILAAASAEAGAFEKAVAWQTKAVALAPDENARRAGQERLALYRAGKPYHEKKLAR